MSKYIARFGSSALAVLVALPSVVEAHTETGKFAHTAFIKAPEVVDCTLDDGTQTHCQRITVGYKPIGLEVGPFCPATLDDEGGIWAWDGKNAGLYRVNRSFLTMLDGLGYRFFDDDGKVHVVDSLAERPKDAHACINVAPDKSVQITMLLPVDPVMANIPSRLGVVSKVGVALDGVPIFSDAPSIQHTGHMPALDVCGGHVDPGGWYHWHATSTDIQTPLKAAHVSAKCSVTQSASAMFGYAFDGFALYGSTDADGTLPKDLDKCHGHVGITNESRKAVYHYHATSTFPNLPSCLVGVQARNNFSTTAKDGIGSRSADRNGPGGPPGGGGPSGGPGGMPPGFTEAADTLGIPSETLMQALRQSGGPPPNLALAAKVLGITEDKLRAALPPPPQR